MKENAALRFVDGLQESLAAFARESYQSDGRGVVLVCVPALPLGQSHGMVSTDMVYQTLEELRRLITELQGDSRKAADVLIRMVETYDPFRQAVLTVDAEGQNPISIKMKLEPAFLINEADGH